MRYEAIALIAGSIGLAVYWFGTTLFFGWGGIFGYGAILVLSTLVLIYGIAGWYRASRDRWTGRAHAMVLAGVLLTAIGLVSTPVISAIGMALVFTGSLRAEGRFPAELAVILAGAVVLGIEHEQYGALAAIRNDAPLPAGTPLETVRWLAGTGIVAMAIGWTWLGIDLARRHRADT